METVDSEPGQGFVSGGELSLDPAADTTDAKQPAGGDPADAARRAPDVDLPPTETFRRMYDPIEWMEGDLTERPVIRIKPPRKPLRLRLDR